MPSHRTPAARRGRPFTLVSAALTAVLLAGVAGASVIQQLGFGLDAPSPASGHAQVIAHGVAPMPAGQVAWRVVTDTAEAVDDAEYQSRALGFALATDDAIVVNSATFGTQTRLAPGEASFVPNNAFELRNSATDQAVPYDRIALVPAEAATDGGGDTLVFAGDAFAAPSLPSGHSGFDLDLVRDVLAEDEETELPDTGFPSLIYVLAGSVEIGGAAQDALLLGAGEAISVPGGVFITAEEDAVVVAALIGPAVPTAPAPPRTTGTITITTAFCPEGMTAEDFDPEQCEAGPVEGGLDLVLADGSSLAADDSRADEGIYTWSGLAFGSYELADPDPQGGFEVYVLLDANGDELDPEDLTISADALDLGATLYFLSVPAETGSLSLATYVCPEGMTPETMVGDFCDLAEPGTFDWQIGPVDASSGEEILTLEDATGDGQPFFTWEDLPFGDYVLSPIQFPEGYALVVVPGSEPGPQQTFNLTIGAAEPDVQLLAYLFLQPEEPTETGSLTATFYVCPEGTSPSDYDPNQCELASGLDYAFAMTNFGGEEQVDRSLDDADRADATATWSNLPLGVWQLYPTPPAGYDLTAIQGADGGDNVTGPYVVELSEVTPDREIAVYFFPPTGSVGTVALVGYQCPTAESTDEECLATSQVYVEADLLDAEGTPQASTLHGNNVVWGEAEGLPIGTYTLVLDLSFTPEGYTLARVAGASDDGDGDPATWAVDVTEGNPNVLTFALFVPAEE